MIPYLEIAMWSRGVRAVGGVNGAPITQSDPQGRTRQARVPLNWWLMPEHNLLTVHVAPLEGASAPPLLDVAIAFPKDEDPPPCRVGWALPPGTAFEPFSIRLPFAPPKRAEARVWRDATPIEALTDAQRNGARALGVAVHAAFAAADVDAILKHLEYRMEEMCLAFEMDLAAHRTSVREDMSDMVATPGFALSPVEHDAIQVHPCCGGRIFQLARADSGPLIATLETATSAPTTMQVFAAFIGGRWRVVR
jgi:hypothetical protein